MPYRVTCKPRPWGGRWRSGRHFRAGEATILADGEMTDAIRQDPELVIEALPDNGKQPDAPRTMERKARPRKG